MQLPPLPPIACQRCGACCGVVPCTEAEFQQIQTYVQAHQIVARPQGVTCPFWSPAACAIYPVRPVLCQLMGHTPRLHCHYGHNVNLPDKVVERLMYKYRKHPASRYVHEVCFLPAAVNELVLQALVPEEC